ncbi:MAG: arginine decarboxylase, pyruvoyl-dependent [Patescibacteria group bacterium]
MFPVPDYVFFTKGIGVHRDKLQSFELALREADIEQQNLVTVSSILPPHCKIITRKEGVKLLNAGSINFCVMARSEAREPGRLINASVGLAQPADSNRYGYLSEHHGYGMTANQSGEYAEDLAATMLATTLGIPFDLNAAWDERKQVYQTSKLIIESRSISAATKSDLAGRWTCVLSAAVFIFKDAK